MPEPAVSVPIDAGPPDKRDMSCNLVASPRAAKTEAGCLSLVRSGKVSAEVVHLPCPPGIVLPIRPCPPGDRKPIEPRLSHRQPGALRYLLQLEHHQCRGVGGVFVRITARLPTPGEQAFGLH